MDQNKKNYCGFKEDGCNYDLSPYNNMKVFFAYPCDGKIKGYIADLCKQKQLNCLTLLPWEKLSDSAGIVFCKICNEIKSSRAVVADITNLNQNVMFELGFAIANRKIPILMREQNRTEKIIDILRDIKRIDYDDIDILAGKLSKSIFEVFPFEEISDTRDQNEPPLIFFVTADASMPLKRYIYRHLEQFANELSYKIAIDDSSEMSGHKLLFLLKKIEESEIVVCHMVGTDYKNFDEINAHVSFMAGYAVGRQKQILILQEKPTDKMIDLQQVRREYKNKDEALDYLNKWLDPIKKQRVEFLNTTKKSEEIVNLHERLSLGHPAAEYDTGLNDYFILTNEYNLAKKQQRTLFLGRRGSGKTANFLKLYKDLANQIKNITTRIDPSKLQLISMLEKLNDKVGLEKITALFEMFWNYVILTEIAICCKLYAQERMHLVEHKIFNKLKEFLDKNVDVNTDFDIRFNRLMDDFCNKILQNQNADLRSFILQRFYAEYYPQLKKIIQQISEEHPIIILIDNLDKDWSSTNKNSISALINSLLNVMNEINIKNGFGNCKVITFLRTDIYKISSKSDPDLDKRQPVFLQWNENMLKHLICERIANVRMNADLSENKLWGSVFGLEFDKIKDTFQYIIKRTMLRPRDLLIFCTTILDQMNKSGEISINENIIIESEKIYSEYLLKSLRQEYNVGYPDIEEICISLFLGKCRNIHEQQLKKRISDNLSMIKDYSIEYIIQFCFDSGILGIKIKGEELFAYQGHELERLKMTAKMKGNIEFVVHPGLNFCLELQ